jgi:hypothetical protein
MAEEMNGNAEVTTENKPTVEELMAQLAQANAEKEKQKLALDKALKEKGEITKQLRSKQTDDELAEQKAKEREERYAEIERENKLIKAQARYVAMGMNSEMALSSASAEIEGDFETVTSNFVKLKNEAIKNAETEWLKSRPQPNAGNGEKQITKEQFDSMSLVELSNLKKSSPELYKQLSGN